MKIIAVTQARYGSTRLPAKVLKEVGNETLLDVHLNRLSKAKNISKLIVATTVEPQSYVIEGIAHAHGLDCYKGSIDNVLERFYEAVVSENPDYIVRITSDCPLIDPKVVDKVIEKCVNNNYDYCSNTLFPTFPDGVDVEVFKFSSLKRAYEEATLKSDKEHVTPYIWRNSTAKGGSLFRSYNYTNPVDFSSYRITVDTQEDFDVIKELIEALGTEQDWKTYISYLDSHPDIKDKNSNHTRNEGYTKSLLND